MLNQIPQVAIQILENSNGSVGFFAGIFIEDYTGIRHRGVISPEIVGIQEKKYTTASLIANRFCLLLIAGFGQQQVRTGSTGNLLLIRVLPHCQG